MALTRDDLATIAQIIAEMQPGPKPPTLQRIYHSVAVGDNQGGGIGGMEPGFLIRGVTVDNPSASWIKLSPTDQYIGPYTFGWSTAILPGSQVIGAQYVIGPTGQLAGIGGSPIVIYLYSDPITNSPGSPFDPFGIGLALNYGASPLTLTGITLVPTLDIAVLPNPGAGVRNRIGGIVVNADATDNVGVACHLLFHESGGGGVIFGATVGIGVGQTTVTFNFPGTGYRTSPNTAFLVDVRASAVGSQTVRGSVLFARDDT